MRLIAAMFLGLLGAQPSLAADALGSEKYDPVFKMDAAYEKGTITESYMKAYHSQTLDTAIKAWETFLDTNNYDDNPSIDDLTDLTLIRQAHYELMRLYYLKGRKVEADELLRKANELVVYSAPEPGEAKKWCWSLGYCK